MNLCEFMIIHSTELSWLKHQDRHEKLVMKESNNYLNKQVVQNLLHSKKKTMWMKSVLTLTFVCSAHVKTLHWEVSSHSVWF